MKIRKLTDTGDILFGKGIATFEKDTPEAVAIELRERFLLFLGDWWLNKDAGLDMFLGTENKDYIDGVIRQHIDETKEVKDILYFKSEIDYEKRIYKAQVRVDTTYGEVDTEIIV